MATNDDYQKLIKAWSSKWALPTTGNLSRDDYRRSYRAFEKAMRGGITGYEGAGATGEGTEYVQYNPGTAVYGNQQGDPESWFKDWQAQLNPEQRAQRNQLYAARDARANRNMQLAAMGAFAGIGGLGALGAGGLGGLNASAVYGPGSGWGADTLSAMGLGGSGLGEGAMGAGAAGLGEGAMGLGTEGVGMYGGGAGGAMGAGMEGAGTLAGGASGLAGSGGSSFLQQVQNVLKSGGSLQDALKVLSGGSGDTNWLNLLGNLGSGWLQSNASGNAVDAQLQAGRESNALLREMWQQGRADQAPYRQAGTDALAGIQALLKDPSSISSMPDYQFGFDQGNKALQNSATARGMTYSGQQAKALQRYGNDYAGTKLNESYNRLASLAGIGQQATNQTGSLGAGYAGQIANNIENQGNVQGAGYIGQGNAWGNAIGGALNGLSEQALIDALLKLKPGG